MLPTPTKIVTLASYLETVEHFWTQWYCTNQSTERIGSIDFVADLANPFVAKVKQGNKPFSSLEQAEAWLQKRASGGSKLLKC
jgi:hypothetical protein